MLTLIFLFLLLNIPLLVSSFIHPRCFWKVKQNKSKDGDLLTSCIFSLGSVKWPVKKEYFNRILNVGTPTASYKFVLALAFSIDEVNRNSDLLPNMSLVFELPAGGCHHVSQLHSLMHNSEQSQDAPPNYVCRDDIGCAMVLTGPYWATSVIMRKVLDLYQSQQFLQLTYGPFHPILSDCEQFPYLYQMAPKDTTLAEAMISLMLHFNWNWIGLAISDNDQGIQFLSYLRTEMEKNTVCFAFVNMIPVNMELYMSRAEVYYNQIMTSSTNVVIIYGDTDSTLAVSFRMWESLGIQKIWVTTSQWDDTTSNRDFTLTSSLGTITFAHHHTEISGFKNFAQTLTHLRYSDEYLARLEWMKFNCEVTESKWKTLKNCSSNASLEWLMVQTFDMAFNDASYDLYNAVYALAHALHERHLQQQVNQSMDNGKGHNFNCLKLHSILRKTHFTNPVGEKVNMNQKEKLQPDYDIFLTWNFLHGLGIKVKIGIFSPYFPHGQQIHLSVRMVDLAHGRRRMSPSVCSADCGPGFRKYGQEGMAACCFNCIPCPQNEVSNETNLHQCVKCPEDQYANTGQTLCTDKAVIFMTYEDPLGLALALMALCFSAFTALVLGVFVKHHDTPIVKANNRNLSYILLISLIFCFLCSLLFIGHPNSVTCILQEITFGVAFTVAVSTVLAKTITVLLAFKVTVPGRRMRYFLVSGAPNYIIVICTLIQIILCAIWLQVSPPSIDIDRHSEHDHIIIMCNKGSATAFYCVLGYHGSLALGSFIVAFLARNLPDTFNEAKLLTFSMLLFCSVWITFLPVYHRTKGKVMVAVEVFSILTSSAGLLGCIFVPKCYIILLRPERNSLKKLKEKAFS
ncbi:vomeronasal type-2 receptor 116-like isoform X4 [Peromyscus californicus insignis]|uniref:vomeronasal type-2 receptor 116-like isoform X4 n=1 Tax=Peromyscus californicus insignis TaxID=564181 RepID=UPI0022A7C50E|nr:vomeronasal type-2 receptor 116-like isoform X4 [Peromyscus californicus insignis]